MTQHEIELEFSSSIKQSEEVYMADWDMLNQAVFHPMVNAVKFNKKGGSIRFTLSMKKINSQRAYLECEIEDSGIGIAVSKIKNLFKTFDIREEEKASSRSTF